MLERRTAGVTALEVAVLTGIAAVLATVVVVAVASERRHHRVAVERDEIATLELVGSREPAKRAPRHVRIRPHARPSAPAVVSALPPTAPPAGTRAPAPEGDPAADDEPTAADPVTLFDSNASSGGASGDDNEEMLRALLSAEPLESTVPDATTPEHEEPAPAPSSKPDAP
jgi:hypothetical protein